ncbi:hypothetical protein IFM89_004068 [Coptis chinensis]|uniref:DET1- and DDB1-associated protein 1 domain-containing protein n=1 Tax=Coptis chinensis TaxID=261450 RepID=A0A835LDE5_9MAGN|nr:hypothetical protein IFM89_004068 [Coptis chinensis]
MNEMKSSLVNVMGVLKDVLKAVKSNRTPTAQPPCGPTTPETEDGLKPIQVAAQRSNRSAVEVLLQVTSPVQVISNWSIDGIIEHMQSDGHKDQELTAATYHLTHDRTSAPPDQGNNVATGILVYVFELTAATYHLTHDRTSAPPDQVIATKATNILLRKFYQHAEDKFWPKRSASENLTPGHGRKQPRGSLKDAIS